MSELTSIIYISCFELYFLGNIICRFWRLYFDYQLSMMLTKLQTIHEKLIRLKVVGPMKIKMNCYFIIGIIIYVIANFITPLVWMKVQTLFDKKDLVINNLQPLKLCHRIKIRLGLFKVNCFFYVILFQQF